MTSAPAERFRLKDAFVLTIAIGVAAGLTIAALDLLLGIAVHPAFGGLVAGVLVAVVFSRRGRSAGSGS